MIKNKIIPNRRHRKQTATATSKRHTTAPNYPTRYDSIPTPPHATPPRLGGEIRKTDDKSKNHSVKLMIPTEKFSLEWLVIV